MKLFETQIAEEKKIPANQDEDKAKMLILTVETIERLKAVAKELNSLIETMNI